MLGCVVSDGRGGRPREQPNKNELLVILVRSVLRYSHMSMRLLLAAVLLLTVGSSAHAKKKLPDPRLVEAQERLPTLVKRIQLANDEISSMEAQFTQTKHSEMLLEPSLAHGVFSYEAPDLVRWEYEDPTPISLLISGDTMTTWYRDLGKAEKTQVGRQSQQVLKYLGASTSVDTLREYFTVYLAIPEDETAPYKLELLPRFSRISKYVEKITIWVDAELFLVSRMHYLDVDGDETDYNFTDFVLNGDIPEERFRLDLPEGLEVLEIDLRQRRENQQQEAGSGSR